MKYNLIITEKAALSIKNNLLFIKNVSLKAALKQNEDFKTAFNVIADDPKIYPFFEGEFIPFNKYYKYVVSKRYVILYQVIDSTVYVDYVIDTRTDYKWLIK